MPDRYFVEIPIIGAHARLEGSEAHHLAHVMRAKPGQQVTLFDGSGAEFEGRVEAVGRSAVDLAIVERREIDRELPRSITLAVALPKGDRQRWLVEKVTELGVARLVPLITARGVAQPVENALARLRRAVIEASKQCGRNRLMEISVAVSFDKFIGQAASESKRWIAHPGESGLRDGASRVPARRDSQTEPAKEWAPNANAIVVAVGPEGGFTEDEVRLATDAGFATLDLGPRILRVETAAIAVAAWAGAAVDREQQA
jgi:16S rRNA (uracil1498-N3)-methyltransferase